MDDPDAVPEHEADAARQRVTLQFDFCKHLTSLSLLAIGGVVTFAGSIFAAEPDKLILWLSAGLFAGAGLCGFSGQMQVLRDLEGKYATKTGWRHRLGFARTVRSYIELGSGAFGMGAGMLVAFAVMTLR